MSYQKSNHKNALLKLVKEKRMILQPDAKSVLNTTSIDYAVKSLIKEGKIKKEKIKVRYSQGNLNDVWLLYVPEVKHEEILDYERILINKPFESPLKNHHCYKSSSDSVKSEPKRKRGRPRKSESNITDEIVEQVEKVVNIQNYVKVNNCELGIKKYNNERVVTFKDIDHVHNRPSGTAKRNFNTNKSKFIENIDYFLLKNKELEGVRNSYGLDNRVNQFYLFTETGYMMLVKSFTDDLSWEVQRKLVNSYFKLKQIKENHDNNLPLEINNIQFGDILEMIGKEFKNQNNKIIELESKFDALKKALS